MAYFIIIGTNNDVECVVDEVKNAHLQHNVVTSGCILSEDGGLYYHWDVFNAKGDKTTENKEPIELHDALTNQISQFKTLVPDGAIPHVFIVSKCIAEDEVKTLQLVYDELSKVGGTTLSGLDVDVVLLGYDLSKPENVTIRPHWRSLESLRGIGEAGIFRTNILYLNNMGYDGAATNIDARMLGKFLCHWSKIVCEGGFNLRANAQSHVYSIGMSEYQYDFRDLNEFFELSAEEILLNRTLNAKPSSDTQELLDTNYFKKINLDLPWLDGLCEMQSIWDSYCSSGWDAGLALHENTYSVSQQELRLASYLNLFLKLYIAEEQREIDNLNGEIAQLESEKKELEGNPDAFDEQLEEDETVQVEAESVNRRISAINAMIANCQKRIRDAEGNIKKNTFIDADSFHENYGTMELLTDEDEEAYATNKDLVSKLVAYVKSEAGINVMRAAIERATIGDELPNPYPVSEVLSMGRVVAIQPENKEEKEKEEAASSAADEDELKERCGCLLWFKGLFGKKTSEDETIEDIAKAPTDPIDDATKESLKQELGKSVAAIRKADEVRAWWNNLCKKVDKYQNRQAECRLAMDGEQDANGNYVKGKEGYRPNWHSKSVSLVEMDKVRNFRDTDDYYKQNIDKYLSRWFNKSIASDKRMTMLELIKHQVLDPLVGKFHTLHWDGKNPFVNEVRTDDEMHEIIDYNLKQSKPFVEYVRIQQQNLGANISKGFFSSNPNIPTMGDAFRKQYNIGDFVSPICLPDFPNSLCVVQVMDIPKHVDALKDFKPRREAVMNLMQTDIRTHVAEIVGNEDSAEGKVKAIYDWMCDNIAYDTTKQIHDAETCYKTRKGVCQAYSELFCYMAEVVGLTADIITGKTKSPDGKISEDRHAWVFVYTNAYEGILIDPTWGAGAVDGVRFVKNERNDIWFNVSPYWMIFSHFPDQQYWTKLDVKITMDDFERLPYKEPNVESDGKDMFFESVAGLNK